MALNPQFLFQTLLLSQLKSLLAMREIRVTIPNRVKEGDHVEFLTMG
jgi:hypothetical protein